MSTDYFDVLGVRRNATNDEIKRAYRKLARELHPDVNPDPEAQHRFKAVTAAYEVLTDPEKRRIVDAGGDPPRPGSERDGDATRSTRPGEDRRPYRHSASARAAGHRRSNAADDRPARSGIRLLGDVHRAVLHHVKCVCRVALRKDGFIHEVFPACFPN